MVLSPPCPSPPNYKVCRPRGQRPAKNERAVQEDGQIFEICFSYSILQWIFAIQLYSLTTITKKTPLDNVKIALLPQLNFSTFAIIKKKYSAPRLIVPRLIVQLASLCNILESHFEISLHKSPRFIVYLTFLCNFPLAHHCTINCGLLYHCVIFVATIFLSED